MLRNFITGTILAYLSRLRYPYLFGLGLMLFLADLAIPDVIPLLDEILLGLATMFVGSFKRRRSNDDDDGAPSHVIE